MVIPVMVMMIMMMFIIIISDDDDDDGGDGGDDGDGDGDGDGDADDDDDDDDDDAIDFHFFGAWGPSISFWISGGNRPNIDQAVWGSSDMAALLLLSYLPKTKVS